MIKAVIFDCDGLLIDSETPKYDAYYDVCKEHGLDLPLEKYVQCVGSSFDVFHPLRYLETTLNKQIEFEQVDSYANSLFLAKMEQQILRDGVVEYLKKAKELGLKVGLASSSPRDCVMGYLTKHEIDQYFDTIHTRDDVKNIKPDPELYNQALSALGVRGDEAIIFEDSVNGLKAAKSAGSFCVIVPNLVTSKLEFDNYDLRIPSMADIELDGLIAKIEDMKFSRK